MHTEINGQSIVRHCIRLHIFFSALRLQHIDKLQHISSLVELPIFQFVNVVCEWKLKWRQSKI